MMYIYMARFEIGINLTRVAKPKHYDVMVKALPVYHTHRGRENHIICSKNHTIMLPSSGHLALIMFM